MSQEALVLDAPEASEETIDFVASDVTNTQTIRARGVQRALPAYSVANALAARLSLPSDVPWVLRDDETSVYLDDHRPIGDQIRPNAKVVLSPRTHLG